MLDGGDTESLNLVLVESPRGKKVQSACVSGLEDFQRSLSIDE